MKRRRFLPLLAFAVLQALVVSFAFSGSAHAATTSLSSNDWKKNAAVFYYDPKDAKAIQDAINSNDQLSAAALGKTSISIKNSFFGNDPVLFTEQAGGTAISGTKNAYYTYTYDCDINSGKVTAATGNGYGGINRVTLAATPKLGKNFDKQQTYSGSTIRILDAKAYGNVGGGHNSGGGVVESDIPTSSVGSKCVPPGITSGTGTLYLTNYNKLSADAKKLFPNIQSTFASDDASNAGANQPDNGDGDGNDGDQCGGTFGWAICPMIDGAKGAVEWIENTFIEPFFHTTPLRLDCGSMSAAQRTTVAGCAEYNVWAAMRNFSNIIFVLIFLAFVFANALSYDLNAYAVKKMLPKLIAAAIIVQFSFLFMAIAIDITNILGAGISSLIGAIVPDGATTINIGADQAGTTLGVGAAIGVVAGTALVTAVSSGAIWVIIAIAFLAMLGIFFTLIFRQILITLLIITAPIAIACMVLPNTEKVYKVWLSNLLKVLLMYPLIMLIFSSSKLFGLAIGSTGGAFAPIFKLVAITVPLFMVPFTFKWAGGFMNEGAKFITGFSGKGKSAVSGSDWAKERRAAQGADRRSLASGNGISIMGKNVGQNGFMTGAARLTSLDKGGVRAQRLIGKDRKTFDDQFNNGNINSPDDLNMAIGGRAHRDEMVARARSRAAADPTYDLQKALGGIEASYQKTKPFHGNRVAAQAAALRLADNGSVTQDTRAALLTSFGNNDAGKAIWGEVGRKASSKQLELQAMNFGDGKVDATKLQTLTAGKSAKALLDQGANFHRVAASAQANGHTVIDAATLNGMQSKMSTQNKKFYETMVTNPGAATAAETADASRYGGYNPATAPNNRPIEFS